MNVMGGGVPELGWLTVVAPLVFGCGWVSDVAIIVCCSGLLDAGINDAGWRVAFSVVCVPGGVFVWCVFGCGVVEMQAWKSLKKLLAYMCGRGVVSSLPTRRPRIVLSPCGLFVDQWAFPVGNAGG